MTVQESRQIEALTTAVNELAKQSACLKSTVELQYRHMRDICDERHGANARAIVDLRRQDRTNSTTLDKLKGMGVPVAICIAVVSVIVGVVT